MRKIVYVSLMAFCVLSNAICAQDAVNLGLSVNWASVNIGASKPQDQGALCEWNSLIPQQQWGKDWRMPTQSEMQELVQECTWSNFVLDGVTVFKITGPNGESIYLPKTGWAPYLKEANYTGERQLTDNGYYWSSTSVQEAGQTMAYVLTCQDGSGSSNYLYNTDALKMGIRPVQDKTQVESVDLGLGVEWASMNLGANQVQEAGELYCMDTTLPQKIWGEDWRLPTHSEMSDLVNKCSWSKSTISGVAVYKITGPNGNSIYLPATGRANYEPDIDYTSKVEKKDEGYYWTSTVLRGMAYALTCQNGQCICDYMYNAEMLKLGIRPVKDIKHDISRVYSPLGVLEPNTMSYYDLYGKRATSATRGINIVNGKKVLR